MLFSNATVVDGTGDARYVADVLVEGGRVARISTSLDHRDGGISTSLDHRSDLDHRNGNHRVIDATGLVLSPGFVDMHAHSDLAVLADPQHLAKVSQGVTTEVIGQDGLAFAPVTDETLGVIRRQIAGWHGTFPDELFTWRGTGEYLDRLHDLACNQAYLVPQGNLRMIVMGNENRAAEASDLDAMVGLLRDGLEAGAVGMSSGLTYTPGMFADTAELEALCSVVAEYGGYYAPHTRGYGGGALAGFAEMIGIGRRTGCPIHLTHATMNFAANRGRANELLDMINAAIAEGLDVTLDSYPYLPGSTTLAALLPSWTAEGGPNAQLDRLRDPVARERMRVELEETGSDGAHGEVVDWSLIQISGSSVGEYVGLTVAELGSRRNDRISTSLDHRGATGAALDLMLADELATGILMHVGDEQNLRAIMCHPQHSGGSDGILVGSRPHPRAWGTFARYLGHYTRDERVLGLEECVKHLAGNPARRLGWTDRGLIKEGYAADLVLFEPATVIDRATFDDPRLPASGIRWVLVNGDVVLEGGARTDARPGHALRR